MKIKPERLVVYADEALLAVNKPAGLPTLPDGYHPDAPYLKGVMEPVYGSLLIVHRLDRDTSGLVAFARTAEAHRSLNTQFETRQVSKIYHALVKGNPDWEQRVVKLPLLPDADRNHRTSVDHRRGKPSLTNLKVLERYNSYTLIEARPESGRTHQIRVHLAEIGFPIAADALYGDAAPVYLSQFKPGYRPGRGDEQPILARLGLHAWTLHIIHPLAEALVELHAPYSKDFGAVVNQLRKTLRV